MILRWRSVAGLTAALLPLGACGGSNSAASDGTPADASSDLLATTSIWADITSNVACGEPVGSLIPAGADPHSFEPSLKDRQSLEEAGVVIANGGGLEGSLTELLAAAIDNGVNVVELAPHVDVLGAGSDEHTTADEHGHDLDGDPHFWQDPTRVAGALDVIADAVVAAGLDADAVAACTHAYRDELMSLDAAITQQFAPIPVESRQLVTSHDSLAYFADRYQFQVVGTVIPATNTLAEVSAGELAQLERTITERRVKAIFTEQLESVSDADALAERLGVRIVPLVTDSLTAQPPGNTYAGMLRSNATLIGQAVSP